MVERARTALFRIRAFCSYTGSIEPSGITPARAALPSLSSSTLIACAGSSYAGFSMSAAFSSLISFDMAVGGRDVAWELGSSSSARMQGSNISSPAA